jgi:hypothetical protein
MWRKNPITSSDIHFDLACQEELEPGCGRRRYCDTCKETVWDTSKMTRAEYERLPQTACIMVTLEDDEMVFAPEPSRAKAALANLAAAGILALPLVGSGCDDGQGPPAASVSATPPNHEPGAASPDARSARPATPEPPLPDELAESERRLVERLKAEYGLDVDSSLDSHEARRPVTLESALVNLEVIQKQRDARTGTRNEVQKLTFTEAVERIQRPYPVIQRRGKVRIRRKKPRPSPPEIIQGDKTIEYPASQISSNKK